MNNIIYVWSIGIAVDDRYAPDMRTTMQVHVAAYTALDACQLIEDEYQGRHPVIIDMNMHRGNYSRDEKWKEDGTHFPRFV